MAAGAGAALLADGAAIAAAANHEDTYHGAIERKTTSVVNRMHQPCQLLAARLCTCKRAGHKCDTVNVSHLDIHCSFFRKAVCLVGRVEGLSAVVLDRSLLHTQTRGPVPRPNTHQLSSHWHNTKRSNDDY